MSKTILLTGSTDGIGRRAAHTLASLGHDLILHGRNPGKLAVVAAEVSEGNDRQVETVVCDLSRLTDVAAFAKTILDKHPHLDVLINNAGVFKTSNSRTPDDLDLRFVVNTIAPYLLTKRLLPAMDSTGRVINVSSAAQAPVDLKALAGKSPMTDNSAYAQSKLAIMMWSRNMALELGDDGPMVVSVNPGSMLGTKMVRDAYGVAGADIQIGADIITKAAVSDAFATASGLYFDNDSGDFGRPHPHALDVHRSEQVVDSIEAILDRLI